MTQEIINLESRDGTKNLLKKLLRKDGEESDTYHLKTSGTTLRVGTLSTGKRFIDPTGGPMIIEGAKLAEADAIVNSIDFSEDFGYTVTFL